MTRPKREEIWLVLKITLLGIAVIGAIGFMVRVIFWFVNLAP
jgi:preprotein translocase subunit Sss1